LDNSSISGEWSVSWQELGDRATFIRRNALAGSTWKTYQRWWDLFSEFLTAFGLSGEPSVEYLLNFLAYLEITGKGYGASAAVSAIGRQCREKGWPDVSKDVKVKESVKGMVKLLADGRLDKDVRQPLPASAIRFYLINRGNRPYKVWIRDAAMLVIGFRAMRRASELIQLRRRDLIWRDGLFIIRVAKSKTDQSGEGREITLEATGDLVTCPVRVISEFLTSDTWSQDDFLFRSAFGKRGKLSISSVSNLVKQVAKDAGLDGKFSSHSLRIGGATAGMLGGLTMEQIRSIGHWESDAILLYLRSIGASVAGASRRMGL
jgi:integrase